MTEEQCDQLAAAMVAHSDAMLVANRKMFADILRVPGGEAMLRNIFAKAKLDELAIQRIISGQARLEDNACLIAAGLLSQPKPFASALTQRPALPAPKTCGLACRVRRFFRLSHECSPD